MIISNKHGIYELPHQLLNYLTLRVLENQEILRRSQILIEFWPSAQPSSQNESLSILAKNRSKIEIELFP